MKKGLILVLIIFTFANVSLSGQTAPNFTITDTDGMQQRLYEDYLDKGKTVLLKIFFVNCPPCRAIAPSMQTLYEEWGEGANDVQFIELSNKSFDSNADVKGYKNQFGITFPGAGFDGGALTALEPYITGTFGSFFGTPEFVVISPNRTVNYGVGGGSVASTIAALDAAIEKTGAKKPIEEVEPSLFEIQIKDAFGEDLTNVDLFISSRNANNDIPVSAVGGILTFDNFAEAYPSIIDPVLKISKADEVQANLSAIDILILLRHILGLVPINDPNILLAADTNNDNSVNSIDLITLQRVILGLITEFPSTKSYQFEPSEISIDPIPGATQQIQFLGIKTGDLNGF